MKEKFLLFIRRHYLCLAVILFTPSCFALICWIEASRTRRFVADGIIALIGVASMIYAKTDAERSAAKGEDKDDPEKYDR
ncbi:MAG: hypothetical protein IJI14_13860 [Anaerolineaceae bacterium]|nr:hypothetical protein [Anaerolineaceae bacterium]